MVRLRGFQKLTTIDEALQKFSSVLQIQQSKRVTVALDSALGRVLAEDVVAELDVPRFDRSAVDGYAVKAKETVGVTQFKPKIFQLTDNARIGALETRQVWTGNPIPANADAVVMLENVKVVGDSVHVWGQVTPGENVSEKGEDIARGETALEAGTRLRPQHLGVIAALGLSEVKVFEKPTVAILATGSELVEPGKKLEKDQIFETNRLVISALCRELGAEPHDLGLARDNVEEISRRLRLGLKECDMVVTSGGTSVGGADLVPDAVKNIGKPGVIVHGIAMRPAMPTALAVVNGKPVLILPGNPVAAIIGFEVFARPLVCRMLGMKQVEPRVVVRAKMVRGIATTLGRKNFVRVRVFTSDDQLLAEPISARGSSMLSTMTKANGYVIVPENREGVTKGEVVSVHLFDDVGD